MSTAAAVATGGVRTELTLGPVQVGELEQALGAVTRAGRPLIAIGPADFPLPTLSTDLDRIAAALEDGPGYAVLRGLCVDAWSAKDLRTLVWAIGRHLGVAVSQDARGRLLAEVGRGTAAGCSGTRGRLHTGGSDVSLYLALEANAVTLVDSASVVDEVTARRPDLATRLFEPFALDLFDQQELGEAPYRNVPLACRHEGRLSLRWPRSAVESAQRFPAVPRLGPAERAVLDLVEAIAEEPGRSRRVVLQPGDLLLVNDHALLQRHEVPEPRVLRLWLTLDRGRALPPGYLWPNPTYGGPHGRGGVPPRDVIEH